MLLILNNCTQVTQEAANYFSHYAAAGGKRKGGKGRGHAPKPQMFEDTSVQPQPPAQYGYGPPQTGYGQPQTGYGYGNQGIEMS